MVASVTRLRAPDTTSPSTQGASAVPDVVQVSPPGKDKRRLQPSTLAIEQVSLKGPNNDALPLRPVNIEPKRLIHG